MVSSRNPNSMRILRGGKTAMADHDQAQGRQKYSPCEPGPRLVAWRPPSSDPGSTRTLLQIKAGTVSGRARRGVVYEYIKLHPGVYVRSMGRDLQIANGDLQYHVAWLEKNGLVKTRRNGFHRFVYPVMSFDESQENLLGVLNRAKPRELLLRLLCDPLVTQRELATRLGCSQPTVSWHMEKLIEAAIVTKTRTGKGITYQILADQNEIVHLLKTFHPSVWEEWAERLEEITLMRSGRRRAKTQEGDTREALLMTPAVVTPIGS